MKKRLNLYNKKTFAKVNMENKMLLQDYMAELELRGKSKGTIFQYKSDIRAFMCWLVTNYQNRSILKVKKRVYRMFLLKLINEYGTSHNRINRFESSLRNLIAFACLSDDYEIDKNPLAEIKGMPKKLVRKIYFLSDNDVKMMIDYCVKHKKYQIALFTSLAYDSAGRRNELHQITKEAIANGASMSNKVTGKEGKHFSLLIFPRSKKLGKLWLKTRGEDNVKSIWRTKENGQYKQASYQTFYYWVLYLRKVLQKCRPDHKYIPFNVHSFRHSALENMSNGTHSALKYSSNDRVTLDVLQIIAHHSSLDTTKSYLQNHDRDKIAKTFNV